MLQRNLGFCEIHFDLLEADLWDHPKLGEPLIRLHPEQRTKQCRLKRLHPGSGRQTLTRHYFAIANRY
jgi:hypothetical protein